MMLDKPMDKEQFNRLRTGLRGCADHKEWLEQMRPHMGVLCPSGALEPRAEMNQLLFLCVNLHP